jgi:hypothetical protein
LTDGWFGNNYWIGLIVKAGFPSKDVVIAIEFEGMNPSKELIVRSPGHSINQ